jgi:hypothetical protein
VFTRFAAGFGLSGFPIFLIIVFAKVFLVQIRNFNNEIIGTLRLPRLNFKGRGWAVYN